MQALQVHGLRVKTHRAQCDFRENYTSANFGRIQVNSNKKISWMSVHRVEPIFASISKGLEDSVWQLTCLVLRSWFSLNEGGGITCLDLRQSLSERAGSTSNYLGHNEAQSHIKSLIFIFGESMIVLHRLSDVTNSI